ncbi:MAG TPA: Gfo/Idh/MocA family oxidoreductase [Bryobacteraceae bacterium]|nr:Gfo/Idh/MocA family oxidoreductase [Bryobacteraceae bacterium]
MPENSLPTRRDVVKAAGVATAAAAIAELQGAPAILKVHAASDQMKYGVIGTGGRGGYLLKHLTKVDNGHCAAICDLDEGRMDKAAATIGTSPAKYKDYRELLADKNVEAVIIAVPLFEHYGVTKDAFDAGKHILCEKSLVFKPEEVHALRALAAQHPKQVLQVGLQRRYSKFYQTAKELVDKGVLGNVTHVEAMWHRNPGWVMNGFNWRLYREYSGGMAAELASHQVDIADWIFGSSPDYVIGVGGLDTWKDGRDVYDNIQLIYKYPNGRKMIYSAISTNVHLPFLQGTRPEFGELIMGTGGSLEITVGDGESTMPTALWYREPSKVSPAQKAEGKAPSTAAGASYALGSTQKGLPLVMATDQLSVGANDSFLQKERKFAQRWLYSKGVMVYDEDRNPVETELESFFNDCHNGGHPKADIEVGLRDSTAVIMSNICMHEERRVNFSEMETLGKNVTPQQMAANLAAAQSSYTRSLAAKKKVS